MSARDRLSKEEQYVAYLIGAGITLVIIALVLIGLGTIDNSTATTSLLLVGLALVVLGAGMWLILMRPWEKFDDLKTPLYTGHEEHAPAEQPEAVAKTAAAEVEAPAAAKPVEAKAAEVEAPAAAEPVEAKAARVEAPAAAEPVEAEALAAHAAETVPVADAPRDDLTRIEGVGPKTQEALYAAGITSFAQVAAMTPESLSRTVQAHGVRIAKTDTWPEQARRAAAGELTDLGDMQKRIVSGAARDDLTQIEGIGPKTQQVLYAAGITTFQQLADSTPDALRKILDDAGLRLGVPASWPEQAALIVKDDLTGLQELQSRLKGGRPA